MSIKLSVIIPCYNAEPYIHELLERLDPQMTDETEVILIDDGSTKPLKLKKDYPWISHFIRQKNGGISKARNRGLELAKGELINFVDADDLVATNYVEYVIGRLDTPDWDYMDLSWKSLEDNRYTFKLNSDNDSLPNPSASTRVFKRSFIGDVRFPEKKDAAEDEDFTRHLQIRKAKHICATEIMYYYRVTTPGSNYKRYMEGKTKTHRIGYYFRHVTADMTDLVDEIKKLEEVHEIFLLTEKNEIPELELYANIVTPQKMRVYEAKGEPCRYFEVLPHPIETQVVIYTSQTTLISGIATFTYNFCKQMSKYYDITVVYDNMPSEHLMKLVPIVNCVRNNIQTPIMCDTLIMNSIRDKIPVNIQYKKSVQMVHCIKQSDFKIPENRDVIVNVSKASKDSFGESAKNGKVLHNLCDVEKTHKALMLVSSFRVDANDKQGNDDRCRKFAKLLDDNGIKYIWLYFADKKMQNEPENMVYCGYKSDIKPYVAKADYTVLLSGVEAYSYSLLESLMVCTPVIVTPLEQNADMGIIDGQNGYIVPFDVDGFDVKKILKIPRFEYKSENTEIIKQWRKILGDSTPKGDYKVAENVAVCVIREYRDMQLNEILSRGDVRTMPYNRALELVSKGFVRMVV